MMKRILLVAALLAVAGTTSAAVRSDEITLCAAKGQFAHTVGQARANGWPESDLTRVVRHSASPEALPSMLQIMHDIYARPKASPDQAEDRVLAECLTAMAEAK